MAVALMTGEDVCQHLEAIIARELDHGNAIASVSTKEYANCDLLVVLRKPFTAHYENDVPSSVTGYVNSDPHYPLGKGYFCSIDRHEVFAPQVLRR
jgi:hypothetical protein